MVNGLTGCPGDPVQAWASKPEAEAATGRSQRSEAMCAKVLQLKSRTATYHPVQVRIMNMSILHKQINPGYEKSDTIRNDKIVKAWTVWPFILVYDQKIESQGQTYLVFLTSATRNEAIDQCAELDSHLVVIKTTSVLNIVKDAFGGIPIFI